MNPNDPPVPIFELYRTDARLAIIDFFINEANRDETYRMGELVEQIDFSRESLLKSLYSRNGPEQLVLLGVVDIEDLGAQIPHYSTADTPVVDFLTEYDGYPLEKLCGNPSVREPTHFFLDQAKIGKAYNGSKIQEVTELGHYAFKDHIDRLVESSIIVENDDEWYTQYQFNQDSDVFEDIETLNELLYQETK